MPYPDYFYRGVTDPGWYIPEYESISIQVFTSGFDACTNSNQNHKKICEKVGDDFNDCHNRSNSKEVSITW